MTTKIREYPDPILRQRSEPVDLASPVERAALMPLVFTLVAAMHDHHGLGLSAVQIGIPKRVFVVHVPGETAAPVVFVNPVIEFPPHTKDVMLQEGCLSFGRWCDGIIRPSTVHCTRMNEHGAVARQFWKGWTARAIQHEMDHLEGRLLIDNVTRAYAKFIDKQVARRLGAPKRVSSDITES